MPSVEISVSLDELAAPHAGIVTRSQLLTAGWSRTAIDRAIQRGQLIIVVPGVYRVAGAPWSRRAAFHAAVGACGQDSLIARWSAAELHRIAEARSGPIDVLTPRGRRVPAGADGLVRIACSRHVSEAERCEIGGLSVTSGARTVLDLAAVQSVARLAELTAAAMRVRACTRDDLLEVLAAHPRARGRGRLRAVLELLDDDGSRGRSNVEVAALTAILAAGLPRPTLGYRVVGPDGRFVAELDLAYPQLRIAIEVDGFAWHSSPARKRADEGRQNQLVVLGWTVLRFSATEVRKQPAKVVATIRAALLAAGVPC